MDENLLSALGVYILYFLAINYFLYRRQRRQNHCYGDAAGWEHLGFSGDEEVRNEELGRLFQRSPWSRNWQGPNARYDRWLDASGVIGVVRGCNDCSDWVLQMPFFAARNRNFVNVVGYLVSPDTYLRGVGYLTRADDREETSLFAELLGYRRAQTLFSRDVSVVALTFYPMRLRIFPQGRRPDAFEFEIADADGERLQPKMKFSNQTLLPLAHPDTHELQQLPYVIVVGNVIDSGEHFNSGNGSRFYHATIDTGKWVVDVVLNGSQLDSPPSIGSFVAGDGRLVAEIIL